MGMFDWLSGKKITVEILEDCIWLSQAAKFTGIAQSVRQCFLRTDSPVAVILIAHFEDCLVELRKSIETESFSGPVTTALAADLQGFSASQSQLGEDHIIEMVIAERHPLRTHDEAVLQIARALPCRCLITQHVSLEDALMKLFAGEWVEEVLKKLGMKEDEVIRSRMVARRIVAAQQKIGSLAIGNQPAKSAQEWIELNCRQSLP
jgi:hypothetical protein